MNVKGVVSKCLEFVNKENYNSIDFIDCKRYYIPFRKEYPHILKDGESYYFLYLSSDTYFSNKLLNMIKIDNFEMFIDEHFEHIAFDQNKTFNYVKVKNKYSELFLFSCSEDENDILKHYILDNKNDEIIRQFDLTNTMRFLPISINKTKESYTNCFYFLNHNGKISLSFHQKMDKPFEIEINNEYITKNYLIPHLKEVRTCFYKPSVLIFKNENLIDFKYVVNKKDYTTEVKKILNELMIKNPEEHIFTKDEIDIFKKLFCL